MTRRVVVGLDRRALRRAMDEKRRRLGLSWREVASRLALSPSTLSRLGVAEPCASALVVMLAWVGHPMGRFALRAEVF